MTEPPHSTKPCERVSRSAADTLAAYLADLTLPAWNEFRAAHGKPPEPPRAGPPVTAEEARAAATEWWQFEVLPRMLPAERAEAEARAATTQPIPRTPAEAARKPRGRRRSISTMIEQAEKAGKPLASLTLPDGTKLDFGKPDLAEPENPWPLDEFRTKETKQ